MKAKQSTSDVTLALLAGVGIGGALMYFLEPRGGARRRALIRDRAAHALRAGKEEFRQEVQDARNRVSGAVAEARARLRHEAVDDDQLVARVRADLGHRVDRAGAIEVAADRGTVTLRGEVSREELDGVLGSVRRVPGVERVTNELNVRETPSGSFASPRRR
jgi:osmotically-inducible protein OsmY